MKIMLKQEVLIKLFDTLEHNILNEDEFSDHFKALKVEQAEVIAETESRIIKTGNKKSMCVNIMASCLSIELRDMMDILIMELCLVNFDYGLNMYENGKQQMFFEANAIYIFHEEEKETQIKEVMIGHINSRSYTMTDKNFYEVLPAETRRKMGDNIHSCIQYN